ncbi:MAG: MFS transporter [Suipraeoptans sp.]
MFDFLKDRNKKIQFVNSYLIFFINGLLALSIGAILPYIRDERGLDYVFCGMILSLHSIGNLASSFAGGILPTFIGRKRSILLFNAFFALAYIFIIAFDNRLMIAAAFFMTGLARGATSNFCNALVNSLAPGKAWIINCLHAMFSVGAFLFPIILVVITMQNPDNWIIVCYFMAIMGAISWILYLMMPREDIKKQSENEDNASEPQRGLKFLREPLFYLCTGVLFFYLCAEQGVIGWLITYFKDTGLMSASLSQVMASVLWIAILAGRLTVAFLSTKINKGKMLILMGVGLVLFFFLLLFSKNPVMIVIGILGFGFSMSGIYPTTVSFAGILLERYAFVWSFILTTASLGSIVMPTIIGRIAEGLGIFYGMSAIVAVVFIDMILIVKLVQYTRKQEVIEKVRGAA